MSGINDLPASAVLRCQHQEDWVTSRRHTLGDYTPKYFAQFVICELLNVFPPRVYPTPDHYHYSLWFGIRPVPPAQPGAG